MLSLSHFLSFIMMNLVFVTSLCYACIIAVCVQDSANGTNGILISFKVLPMVPLVKLLVPMVMSMVPLALPMVSLVPNNYQW